AGVSGAGLPARVVAFEAMLPEPIAGRPRGGVWLGAGVPARADRVGELMVAAWLGQPCAARGWRLRGELAATQKRSLDAVAAELDDGALERSLSADERGLLGDR